MNRVISADELLKTRDCVIGSCPNAAENGSAFCRNHQPGTGQLISIFDKPKGEDVTAKQRNGDDTPTKNCVHEGCTRQVNKFTRGLSAYCSEHRPKGGAKPGPKPHSKRKLGFKPEPKPAVKSVPVSDPPAGLPAVIEKDMVNHPPHYGGEDNPYEAIKVIEAWELCWHLGNAVKYLARAGKKGDELEDLKKARFYLDRKISLLEEERARQKS